MKFSIVTPSFRNSEWLKLCIASVADQDCPHEHIVQDSCSDDGTGDWLPHDERVSAFIEKDRGMYDAVNRGFRRAQGELLAYINCDEQYLPGALTKVAAYFDAHPEVEILFGDAVVVDPSGNYLCDRRSVPPSKYHALTAQSLPFLTCSTFMRQSVMHERGLYFDERFRDLGDTDWAVKIVNAGARMAVLREYTSVFTDTGENMNLLPNAKREAEEMFARAPAWARALRPAIKAHNRLLRLLSGVYSLEPHDYSIYTREQPDRRTTFSVQHPTFRWKRYAL